MIKYKKQFNKKKEFSRNVFQYNRMLNVYVYKEFYYKNKVVNLRFAVT